MAEYTLKYINHRAECDAEAFVNDCEEHYHRQLHLVADQIAANCKRKPVVLLNGPSSSGKTTTNDRLGRILELAGIHAHMISMDDYYRTSGTYDIPFDEEKRRQRPRKPGVHGFGSAARPPDPSCGGRGDHGAAL